MFDWISLRRASNLPGPALIFGYNTALLNELLRQKDKPFIVNMDGVEWKRRKWSAPAKVWLRVNETIALRRANYVIADHPAIAEHLQPSGTNHRLTMIPYGSDRVDAADPDLLHPFGLLPGRFATIIARPEPENSILEMVRTFSQRKRHGLLALIGQYSTDNSYQRSILQAASNQVSFLGPIYDPKVVESLRFHSAFYMYGHTVGGTSPTLVEALGAGCTALCLDTPYSRWVAGESGRYFTTNAQADRLIDELFDRSEVDRTRSREQAYQRFESDFTWTKVLGQYEDLLLKVSA